MKIKMILPSLTEAESPYNRPVKYSLFPPLGLATLAAYCHECDEIDLVDQHVEKLSTDDCPDLVVIQVYITNAYRAYQIADTYRSKGCYVILGGLHVTSLPDEAKQHADSVFIGPGEDTFPEFLKDFRAGKAKPVYRSIERSLDHLPPVRRDLIKRHLYLVPNSIVVSRGCPFHCSFCYKDAFFGSKKSFYTQKVDDALREIERLPGRHLYFLDDHLLGDRRFASALFDGMYGMNRVFQGAATVNSILKGDLIEKAAKAGLRSIFVGFESVNDENMASTNKYQNIHYEYEEVCRRLNDLGIMINGSFVFGLDHDGPDVFRRTVDWALRQGITTATFHIATPYPGTAYYQEMQQQRRILHSQWDRYDTRQVVFQPKGMSTEQLKQGYDWSYREFYRWKNIVRSASAHSNSKHMLKHFFYTAGWKKFESLWTLLINGRRLGMMTPLLEAILSKVSKAGEERELGGGNTEGNKIEQPGKKIDVLEWEGLS
ncbi:B12-binding domain-containing radical SAM protein [Hahella sp. CCB-MM4]|uniref:B12-binding domain-containing radical SAM protein n=1 Tax=Hahella sp. (strain CCB-MM4) TaxID=1926491 RepID=UPI000B9BFEFC|nr:radical SAM protein [Hahella sp. CCB-MM4]